MRPVFLDKNLQDTFWEQGYVKLQLFTPGEINELKNFYNTLQPNSRFNEQEKNVKYHFTFLDDNKEYKNKVFEHISRIIQPKIDTLLNNYEPLVINFVQKEPGLGEVPIHQNWSFVEEDKFVSVSIWCPLVDVAEINGTLEVIDKTHRLFRDVIRSPSIPWFFTGYENHMIQNYCKPLEVKAGEVVIFDDSIIHYSKPNHGTYNRLVIQVIAKPKEAQAKHYYFKKGWFKNEMTEMDVDKNFFLNFKYNIKEKSDGELRSKEMKYQLPRINRQKFDELLNSL